MSTLIAPEFNANRPSNFKLQFRSPAIATIHSQSREMRQGERQCHSELHVAVTTLQHLVLYLINCDMNSAHAFVILLLHSPAIVLEVKF